MADDEKTTDAGTATADATATTTTAATTDAGKTADKGKSWTLEDAVTEIGKLNHEAASRRVSETELKKKLKGFEDAETEAERKKLEAKGEHQKLAQQAEERASKFKERAIRAELRAAAVEAGIIDPVAVDLIKLDSVTMDDVTGEITGVSEALEAFKTSRPKFFAAPAAATTTAAVQNTGTTKQDPPPAEGASKFDAMALSAEDYERERRKAIFGS